MEQKRCYGCMQMKTAPVCEHCGYDEQTQNADHQLPVGTVLREQYLIGRALGQGGFGITYLGWDLYLDLPVAIKEYYPNGAVMRESAVTLEVSCMGGEVGTRFRNNKDRFMREAKMLARFAQVPEIVQVRNFFLANNTAYIVMEYIEGVDLKHYVRQKGGKLSIDECFEILVPVMKALEKVHKTGLVHRDISPDNIMMLPNGRAKLLDFGAVRDVGAADPSGSLTQSTEAILKQGYAPIEQYQSRGSLGPWTDVYAMGATIWFCLTGSVPPDAPARMLQDMDDLPWAKEISGLEPEQIRALNHAMELRSNQRTASIESFVEELFQEPVVDPDHDPDPPIPPDPPGPTPDPKPQRKLGFPALVGGLALAIVVCLVVAFLPKEDPASPITGDIVSGTCGDQLRWELNRETGELTIDGEGDMYYFRHPSDETNQAGEVPWNDLRGEIKKLTIGDRVLSIGRNAFTNCENLTEVNLGNWLQVIGESAFENVPITEIELPERLDTIGPCAFMGTRLKSVVLPDTLERLEFGAFSLCPELKEVTVGRYTAINNYDFYWAETLPFSDEHGQVPENFMLHTNGNPMAVDLALLVGYPCDGMDDSTWEWDDQGQCGDTLYYYFDEQTGLLKIDGTGPMWDFNSDDPGAEPDPNRALPPWYYYRDRINTLSVRDGVTSIGEFAFHGCGNLWDLYLGQTLETIKFQAFCGTSIDELVLPDSVRLIEDCAFNWCGNLYMAKLPEELERLNSGAFPNCSALEHVYAGAKTEFGDESQDYLTPFNEHENSGQTPKNLTIYSSDPSGPAARFAEEEGHGYAPSILSHGGGLFDETWADGQCGENVFWYINGETLVLYGDGTTDIFGASAEDVVLFESFGQRATEEMPSYYKYRRDIGRIVILPGVDQIEMNAFADMPDLHSIDFGTVHTAFAAFRNCGIQEVYLPETMKYVGNWLFGGCTELRKVTIAGGSQRVEECIFAGCEALEEVWWIGGKELINGDLLHDNDGNGKVSDHLTFYVREGSDAQSYAQHYGVPYEIIQSTM